MSPFFGHVFDPSLLFFCLGGPKTDAIFWTPFWTPRKPFFANPKCMFFWAHPPGECSLAVVPRSAWYFPKHLCGTFGPDLAGVMQPSLFLSWYAITRMSVFFPTEYVAIWYYPLAWSYIYSQCILFEFILQVLVRVALCTWHMDVVFTMKIWKLRWCMCRIWAEPCGPISTSSSFHASSRSVFSLHAHRIRPILLCNYRSSTPMRTLSMTVFYVLKGTLIIIM